MKKITAVIVTFNSEKCIGRLIDKLLSQSYPIEKIIISDNNSSDNTCNIIDDYRNTKIQLCRLKKNLGGAGGFANGFDIAKNSNCDYIISFDDDAYPPDDNFILDMIKVAEQYHYDVVAPLVVDSDNHSLSAYEYAVNKKPLKTVNDIQKVQLLENDIKLFNGVLFHKKVVDKIGIPRAEFFIRGDEQEYKMRILKAGFKIGILTQAIVYHPTSVNEYFYIKGKRYHHLDSPFKLFYSVRNQAYMLRLRDDINTLRKTKIIYKQFVRYTWFYLVYKKDIKSYCIWLKAFMCGILSLMDNNCRG